MISRRSLFHGGMALAATGAATIIPQTLREDGAPAPFRLALRIISDDNLSTVLFDDFSVLIRAR